MAVVLRQLYILIEDGLVRVSGEPLVSTRDSNLLVSIMPNAAGTEIVQILVEYNACGCLANTTITPDFGNLSGTGETLLARLLNLLEGLSLEEREAILTSMAGLVDPTLTNPNQQVVETFVIGSALLLGLTSLLVRNTQLLCPFTIDVSPTNSITQNLSNYLLLFIRSYLEIYPEGLWSTYVRNLVAYERIWGVYFTEGTGYDYQEAVQSLIVGLIWYFNHCLRDRDVGSSSSCDSSTDSSKDSSTDSSKDSSTDTSSSCDSSDHDKYKKSIGLLSVTTLKVLKVIKSAKLTGLAAIDERTQDALEEIRSLVYEELAGYKEEIKQTLEEAAQERDVHLQRVTEQAVQEVEDARDSALEDIETFRRIFAETVVDILPEEFRSTDNLYELSTNDSLDLYDRDWKNKRDRDSRDEVVLAVSKLKNGIGAVVSRVVNRAKEASDCAASVRNGLGNLESQIQALSPSQGNSNTEALERRIGELECQVKALANLCHRTAMATRSSSLEY